MAMRFIFTTSWTHSSQGSDNKSSHGLNTPHSFLIDLPCRVSGQTQTLKNCTQNLSSGCLRRREEDPEIKMKMKIIQFRYTNVSDIYANMFKSLSDMQTLYVNMKIFLFE